MRWRKEPPSPELPDHDSNEPLSIEELATLDHGLGAPSHAYPTRERRNSPSTLYSVPNASGSLTVNSLLSARPPSTSSLSPTNPRASLIKRKSQSSLAKSFRRVSSAVSLNTNKAASDSSINSRQPSPTTPSSRSSNLPEVPEKVKNSHQENNSLPATTSQLTPPDVPPVPPIPTITQSAPTLGNFNGPEQESPMTDNKANLDSSKGLKSLNGLNSLDEHKNIHNGTSDANDSVDSFQSVTQEFPEIVLIPTSAASSTAASTTAAQFCKAPVKHLSDIPQKHIAPETENAPKVPSVRSVHSVYTGAPTIDTNIVPDESDSASVDSPQSPMAQAPAAASPVQVQAQPKSPKTSNASAQFAKRTQIRSQSPETRMEGGGRLSLAAAMRGNLADSNSSSPAPIPMAAPTTAISSMSPKSQNSMTDSVSALSSPASSMIFERNVQEFAASGSTSKIWCNHENTHYHGEDHIAPALDASTEAIINTKVNPNDIDVISLRRPSSIRARSPTEASLSSLWSQTPASPTLLQDTPRTRNNSMSVHPLTASHTGGSLSPDKSSGDRQVLSFCSFADVVHTENEETQVGSGMGSSDRLGRFDTRSQSALRSPSPLMRPHPVGSPLTAAMAESVVADLKLTIPPSRSATVDSMDSESPIVVSSFGETIRRRTSELGL